MIRLLWRSFRSSPWPTVLLALTVALLSLIVAIVPRLTSQLDDRQLETSLDRLSALKGDVSGNWASWAIAFSESSDPWKPARDAAEATRQGQPEPLRSLLQPAQFVGRQPVAVTWTPPTESGYWRVSATLLLDPDVATTTRLVAGQWPRVAEDDQPYEVAVLDLTAAKANVTVGDVLVDQSNRYRVVGIFTPNDPSDPRWEHVPFGRSYSESVSPDTGTELLGGLFLAPELAAGDPSARIQAPWNYEVYFGLDTASVRSGGVGLEALSSQLTGMLAKRYPPTAADQAPIEGNQPMAFHSELGDLLELLLTQQRTTHTLITVSAVGPIGVGIALVALCAQLVLYRRSSATTLLLARGLSKGQLRGLLAAEGLIAGIPAAIAGQLTAQALVAGPVRWWSWPLTVAIAAVPAAALALAARNAGSTGRRELGSGRGRWRLVAELLVALAAAGATWRLLTTKATRGAETDLLGAAAPILLTLLACLIVLRFYPLPLRVLLRGFSRGRGFTGFMGSARALREPAGGVVPVVTIVLGTTIAIAAASLLGTIAAGTERAVWNENGSSIHVSGPRMGDAVGEQLRAIDGVDSAAFVRLVADNAQLKVGDRDVRVRIYVADEDLSRAYEVSPAGSPLPAAVFAEGSPVAIVAGGEGAPSSGTGTLQGLGDVRVVGHSDLLPGVTSGGAWAFVARAHWPEQRLQSATTALLSVKPGADLTAITDEISTLLPLAKVSTSEQQLDELRGSPTVAGLSSIFVFLTAVTAVLMVLAIFTAQVMTANDRRAAGAVLRTLGLTPRQLGSLTAWELGPVVLVALILGAGVGIGVAALMLGTVDFRALTGGALAPTLHLDPLWVGGVGAMLLLATALAVGISSWLAGRTNIANELRLGEER